MSEIPSEIQQTPVLIVGAGPVGLLTALNLARYGIKCTLVERNVEPTRWPKMDITNCRSMELLKQMGLAEKLREIGVPIEYSFDVILSAGLNDEDIPGKTLAKWSLPSPKQWQQTIASKNDGTQPSEPYQRSTQTILEKLLREICAKTPEITTLIGWKFDSLQEDDQGVCSILTEVATGTIRKIQSKYLLGTDGPASNVRKAIGVKLEGQALPLKAVLVHFKSNDLTRIQSQGQFWHIFFTHGGILICQNEKDIWTAHLPFPEDVDVSNFDPKEIVYQVLGGNIAPYPIKIDEIFVHSTWKPSLYVADRYRSVSGKVFLAGDSAHQNIPTGGYGMNTGLGDAFDISWKVAAILKGFAGPALLDSYEIERRPVGERNVPRSGLHMQQHIVVSEWVRAATPGALTSKDSEEGSQLRAKINGHYTTNDGENKEFGVELDYRLEGSPVINLDTPTDPPSTPPPWNPRSYTPSTHPGHRAPHIFLSNGKTPIFSLYGLWFTLVDFTSERHVSRIFTNAAQELGVPLKVVRLLNEPNVRRLWERDVVLVRPDGFVCWRGVASVGEGEAKRVLARSVGREI
ncbi:MAG: hypothetical protein MMC33_003690 [Icmadophila ericetorum]|nr:hypothetical protein [Icmadophila ericetorum]